MKQFRDRVAVITGAASGFGREFARTGARLGMKLVLADVQRESLDALEAELRAGGADVMSQLCDVRHGDEVQALAEAAVTRYGSIHLLFNNAGVAFGGLIWETREADWDWVLGVNLWGVIHGVRIFTPLMLEASRNDPAYEGHIVNTASMAGLVNAPTMSAYNVSKQAVVSLSETLYHDLALIDSRIGASVLCPYFVPTGIAESHRNRPKDLQNGTPPTASQLVTQAMMSKAVASGKVTAAEVADRTYDAVRDGLFYIYSHPDAMDAVRARAEDILTAGNPTDPYLKMPQIGEMLRAKLRS